MICLGYVGGIGHMLNALDESAAECAAYCGSPVVETALLRMGVCGDATVGAYKKAFVNWAERNPANWTSHMGVGVALALRETWPCGSEQTQR